MMGLSDNERRAQQNQLRMNQIKESYSYAFIAHIVIAVIFFILAGIYVSRTLCSCSFYAGSNAGAFQVVFALATIAIGIGDYLRVRMVNYVAIGIYILLLLTALMHMSLDAVPNLLMALIGGGANAYLLTVNNKLQKLKKEPGYPLFSCLDEHSEYVLPAYVRANHTAGHMDTIGDKAPAATQTNSVAAQMMPQSFPSDVQTERLIDVPVQMGSHADSFGTADLREDVSAFAETATAGRKEDFSELSEPSPNLALSDMTEVPSSYQYAPHAEQLPSREEVMERLRSMKDFREEQ